MQQGLGKNALLTKNDIQSAFRILPINPNDFELLGIKFKGKINIILTNACLLARQSLAQLLKKIPHFWNGHLKGVLTQNM
jgi:hypothetical protein